MIGNECLPSVENGDECNELSRAGGRGRTFVSKTKKKLKRNEKFFLRRKTNLLERRRSNFSTNRTFHRSNVRFEEKIQQIHLPMFPIFVLNICNEDEPNDLEILNENQRKSKQTKINEKC